MSKSFYNVRDSYNLYKKEIDNPVKLSIYLNIVHGFLKFIMDKIFNGDKVIIPERLGTIEIQGKKPNLVIDEETNEIKGLSADWYKTKLLWENNPKMKEEKRIVYHTNDHTNGIRYRFVWHKKKVIVENKMAYALRFTRTNKRRMSSKIKSGKEYRIL